MARWCQIVPARVQSSASGPDKGVAHTLWKRDVAREATVVLDEFPLFVKEGRVTAASNMLAHTVLVSMLEHYAIAFSDRISSFATPGSESPRMCSLANTLLNPTATLGQPRVSGRGV